MLPERLLVDQFTRGFGRQLDRNAILPTVGMAHEVDCERMIERRVEGMVEVDVGGVDEVAARLGEGVEDLQDFNQEAFIAALFGQPAARS